MCRTHGTLEVAEMTVAGRSLCFAGEKVDWRFLFCFTTWASRENDFFRLGDLVALPSEWLEVMHKFHMSDLDGWAKMAEIEPKRVPVDTEICER